MLLLGKPHQLLPELRRGDVDERLHPLADRLAVQIGHAVLGDDVVDVVAGRDHARALLQHRHDAADGAVLGRAGSAMIGTPPGERDAP